MPHQICFGLLDLQEQIEAGLGSPSELGNRINPRSELNIALALLMSAAQHSGPRAKMLSGLQRWRRSRHRPLDQSSRSRRGDSLKSEIRCFADQPGRLLG